MCRRREWDSGDEPCQQKLSFDLWLSQKAGKLGAGSESYEVFSSCLGNDVIDMVELSVDEVNAFMVCSMGRGAGSQDTHSLSSFTRMCMPGAWYRQGECSSWPLEQVHPAIWDEGSPFHHLCAHAPRTIKHCIPKRSQHSSTVGAT